MSKRKKSKKKATTKMGGIITNEIVNYENHPYFTKKDEEAKEFIKVAGLPKELRGQSL